MGTVSVDEFLSHWGVKGMKWGVRNDAKKAAKAEKKSSKADTKWQKNIYSLGGAIDVHNHVAHTMNTRELPELNNTPKYKKHVDNGGKLFDITGHPIGKVGEQYWADYNKRVLKAHNEAVAAVHGTSPSGKHKAELDTSNPSQWRVKVSPVGEATHAVDGMGAMMPEAQTTNKKNPTIVMNVERDPETGCIGTHSKIKEDDTTVSQSDPAGSFLTHWGVKGMKWGVRNDKKSSSSGSGKSAGTNNKKQVHEMTDEELKTHVARMELENRYKNLSNPQHSKKKSAGKAFAADIGKTLAKQAIQSAGNAAIQKALTKGMLTEKK